MAGEGPADNPWGETVLSTTRSRVRALSVAGMAAVVAAVGAVSYNANASTTAQDTRSVSIPTVDEAIKPPDGSRPVGAYVVVKGTQNYACAADGTYSAPSTPEAQLIGTGGRLHHFAGPSWQSLRDGSLVTGKKIQAGPPREGAIPE